MANDNDGDFTYYGDKPRPRTNQRTIQPTAVKPAGLGQQTLTNTNTQILGPFSMPTGSSLAISVITYNNSNHAFRIGATPFNLVFFEDALDNDHIIGLTVSANHYNLWGPLSLPQILPAAYVVNGTNFVGGNDSNNLVFIASLYNDTGMTHNIWLATDTRVYTPIGGAIT